MKHFGLVIALSLLMCFGAVAAGAEEPRQQGIGLKTRLRHYTNLARMHDRLATLLAEFRWGRMDEVFLGRQAAPAVDLARLAAVGA